MHAYRGAKVCANQLLISLARGGPIKPAMTVRRKNMTTKIATALSRTHFSAFIRHLGLIVLPVGGRLTEAQHKGLPGSVLLLGKPPRTIDSSKSLVAAGRMWFEGRKTVRQRFATLKFPA
jgi:hypothetical protein